MSDGFAMAMYEITLRGNLGPRLTAALSDLEPRSDDALTVLHAELGSPELSEVLSRIRDFGLELIDVRLIAVTEPPRSAG